MKRFLFIVISTASIAYCQSSVPLVYDAGTGLYPKFQAPGGMMDEELRVRQGKSMDSIVYISGNKISRCMIWRYSAEGTTVYHASYRNPAEPPVYQKFARYNESGLLAEWWMMNSHGQLAQKKVFDYNAMGEVTEFHQYSGPGKTLKKHIKIVRSHQTTRVVNLLQDDEIGCWTWEYRVNDKGKVLSITVVDSLNAILYQVDFDTPDCESRSCCDSTSRYMQSESGNDDYRTVKTYIRRYQKELQSPDAADSDLQEATANWSQSGEDLLLEITKFDKNDTMVARINYYYEGVTPLLKYYHKGKEKQVVRTEKYFNSSGQPVSTITVYPGGYSRQEFIYTSSGILERMDHFNGRKRDYQVLCFSR